MQCFLKIELFKPIQRTEKMDYFNKRFKKKCIDSSGGIIYKTPSLSSKKKFAFIHLDSL